MANTPGGGALIVGAADDGRLIGTAVDAEWLRARIYELTQRRLTVEVEVVMLNAVRLLLIRSPEAIEPIRNNNKISWRVSDRCVEVDASTWHARTLRRAGFDWSAQKSGHRIAEVRSVALGRARDFLSGSGEAGPQELAEQLDVDLFKRLNVVIDEDWLTNAGALAFVGHGPAALDYQRRDYAGGDTVQRIEQANRGLVEELYDVERAISAVNPIRHLPGGLASGQIRELPERAVREAIVNGVVHRDWTLSAPTIVEYIGSKLVVTSPGGFVGGVAPDNIITHPSSPRNPALAQLCAALRIAEREGIGVDRMYGDMIRVGNEPPVIEEIAGPFVRAVLVGEEADAQWIRFLAHLQPPIAGRDLNALLLLRHVVRHIWIDARRAAPLLQQALSEAKAAITALTRAMIDGQPILESITGIPVGEPAGWHISAAALSALGAPGTQRVQDSRAETALAWAQWRGRISTTELGSIVGAYATNLGTVLTGLERQGILRPSSDTRRGAGFDYILVDSIGDAVDQDFG